MNSHPPNTSTTTTTNTTTTQPNYNTESGSHGTPGLIISKIIKNIIMIKNIIITMAGRASRWFECSWLSLLLLLLQLLVHGSDIEKEQIYRL